MNSVDGDFRLSLTFTMGSRPCYEPNNGFEHELGAIVADAPSDPNGDVSTELSEEFVSLNTRGCWLIRIMLNGRGDLNECHAAVVVQSAEDCATMHSVVYAAASEASAMQTPYATSATQRNPLYTYRVVPNVQPGETHTIDFQLVFWPEGTAYIGQNSYHMYVLWDGETINDLPADYDLKATYEEGLVAPGLKTYKFVTYASYLENYIVITDNVVNSFEWTNHPQPSPPPPYPPPPSPFAGQVLGALARFALLPTPVTLSSDLYSNFKLVYDFKVGSTPCTGDGTTELTRVLLDIVADAPSTGSGLVSTDPLTSGIVPCRVMRLLAFGNRGSGGGAGTCEIGLQSFKTSDCATITAASGSHTLLNILTFTTVPDFQANEQHRVEVVMRSVQNYPDLPRVDVIWDDAPLPPYDPIGTSTAYVADGYSHTTAWHTPGLNTFLMTTMLDPPLSTWSYATPVVSVGDTVLAVEWSA
jgi:hypothetical protein